MRPAQLSAQELVGVLRRRKRHLIYPFLIVILISTLGALLLPKKYESSTTILVQRDEILNPLVNYTMAVSIASEDRLKTFNEIVYSNASIQKRIDSLNLDSGVRPGKEMEDLIKTIKKNIETERPGSATFKISFTDTDPLRAQRGALLLAHHFIAEILKVENQRNELAVQFFEKKLDEFRDKFESQQKEMVNLLRTRVQESPVENKTLISNVEEVDKDVAETEQKVKDYERGLSLIQQVSSGLSTEGDKQALFDLDRMDLPQIAQLHPLV